MFVHVSGPLLTLASNQRGSSRVRDRGCPGLRTKSPWPESKEGQGAGRQPAWQKARTPPGDLNLFLTLFLPLGAAWLPRQTGEALGGDEEVERLHDYSTRAPVCGDTGQTRSWFSGVTH